MNPEKTIDLPQVTDKLPIFHCDVVKFITSHHTNEHLMTGQMHIAKGEVHIMAYDLSSLGYVSINMQDIKACQKMEYFLFQL